MRSRAVCLPLACWRWAARSSAAAATWAVRSRKAVVVAESAMVVPLTGAAPASAPAAGAWVVVMLGPP